MPVIKVWCLPKLPERKLTEVFRGIVAAVIGVRELGLKSENDISIIAPVGYHASSAIIVEVTGLFVRPERTPEVRQRLAEAIRCVIRGFFQTTMVEVFVFPFDPTQGFSMNPRAGRRHKPTEGEIRDLLDPNTPH